MDPAFGTGAVKVTPAHDPNDFAMGQRHGLPQVSVIDEDAKITEKGGPYAGQDRFKARAGIVEQLEREGLLEKIADHEHAVGTCQRCTTVVEPLVSTQWFVKIEPLAKDAIRVVEEGQVRFFPENWTKTYYDWMYNIHDWCISRQLWWGHRIPAWYCAACGEMIVSEQTPERCPCGGELRQDPDVLDTWFSSQLWPFSTMGWPDQTADLQRYYPTDLMLTAFDIIFFWVARMIMAGVKFAGDIPFHTVYITGLVRDERGQKMSKSKGNVVDPLEVMDEIGADALRFTLTAMAAPGMDIPLSEGRMTGLPAVHQQDLERLALRADERRRSPLASRSAGGRQPPADPPLDPPPVERGDRGGEGGASRRSGSTTRPTGSITSSGTSTRTGTSRWSSSTCRPRGRSATWPARCCSRCTTGRCGSCTRSSRS